MTGSSSGIGRAIAERLADDFSAVIVHGYRNRTGAAETVANLEARGVAATMVMADLSDPVQRQRAIAEALNWRGVPHVLINNAGLDVLTGEAKHWSFEEKLSRLWSMDVMGTIAMSRELGQHMRSAHVETMQENSTATSTPYSIINMGWDQAEVGMEGDSGEMFTTIKGAVMAFTRSLARSLAPHVRVNCIAPGWIRTKWGDSTDAYWNARATQESLLGRWGTAEDVAGVVRFLVSDAASFVNGQIVPVNGGFAGTLWREP